MPNAAARASIPCERDFDCELRRISWNPLEGAGGLRHREEEAAGRLGIEEQGLLGFGEVAEPLHMRGQMPAVGCGCGGGDPGIGELEEAGVGLEGERKSTRL